MRFNLIHTVHYLRELATCCIPGKEVLNFRTRIRVSTRVSVMTGSHRICVGVGVVVASMVGCRESWSRGCRLVRPPRPPPITGFFRTKALVLFSCKHWVFNSCWWDERRSLGPSLSTFCILVALAATASGSIWFESWVPSMPYDMCPTLMVPQLTCVVAIR